VSLKFKKNYVHPISEYDRSFKEHLQKLSYFLSVDLVDLLRAVKIKTKISNSTILRQALRDFFNRHPDLYDETPLPPSRFIETVKEIPLKAAAPRPWEHIRKLLKSK